MTYDQKSLVPHKARGTEMHTIRSSMLRESGPGSNLRSWWHTASGLEFLKVLKVEQVTQSRNLSGPASPPLRVENVMKIHGAMIQLCCYMGIGHRNTYHCYSDWKQWCSFGKESGSEFSLLRLGGWCPPVCPSGPGPSRPLCAAPSVCWCMHFPSLGMVWWVLFSSPKFRG